MGMPLTRRRDPDTALWGGPRGDWDVPRGDFALWGGPRDFADIFDRMGRMFNAALGAPIRDIAEDLPWVPDADIYETDDAYVVEAELPGVDKDRIDIELRDDGELVVSGDIVEREGRGLLHRRERRVGDFELRAYLPDDIDPDGVEADLSEGVLTIRVPKAQSEQRPRRIEISG